MRRTPAPLFLLVGHAAAYSGGAGASGENKLLLDFAYLALALITFLAFVMLVYGFTHPSRKRRH